MSWDRQRTTRPRQTRRLLTQTHSIEECVTVQHYIASTPQRSVYMQMLSQIGAFSRECIWLSMRGRHVTICARCDVSRSATCRANYLPLSGRERLHTESRYIHRKNLHNIHYTIYSKIDAEWPWFSKMSQEHAHLVASFGEISLVFFCRWQHADQWSHAWGWGSPNGYSNWEAEATTVTGVFDGLWVYRAPHPLSPLHPQNDVATQEWSLSTLPQRRVYVSSGVYCILITNQH